MFRYISFWEKPKDILADKSLNDRQKEAAVLILKSKFLMPIDGGYPDQAAFINDYIVFASSDENEPSLAIYKLESWFEEEAEELRELLEEDEGSAE